MFAIRQSCNRLSSLIFPSLYETLHSLFVVLKHVAQPPPPCVQNEQLCFLVIVLKNEKEQENTSVFKRLGEAEDCFKSRLYCRALSQQRDLATFSNLAHTSFTAVLYEKEYGS